MNKCSVEECSISERYMFLVLCKIKGREMYTILSFNIFFGKILRSGFKYRDRTTIIGDILDSINSDPRGKTKTSIMRAANLSLEQVNKYLYHLVLSGIVTTADPLESQELARYRLTAKGLRLARDVAMWRYNLALYHQKAV